jgi:hypothetical protein
MSKSTAAAAADKPRKPDKLTPDFPLFARWNETCGRWAKKVRGNLHQFGPWDDPDGALARWLEQEGDLLAGRVPRQRRPDVPTRRDLTNAYLTHKRALMTGGELSATTFTTYHQTRANLVAHFGKDRQFDDFRQDVFAAYRVKLAKRLEPVALGNEIQRTRGLFKFGLESGIVTTPRAVRPGVQAAEQVDAPPGTGAARPPAVRRRRGAPANRQRRRPASGDGAAGRERGPGQP